MSTTKEITESLGFGVIFATVKALVDYASEKKVTVYFSEKNTVITAGAGLVYDFGKTKKW